MRDFFITFMVSAILFIAGVGLFIGIWCVMDFADCRGFATTGYETKWAWGCYAKVDGQWLPKDYVFGRAHELRLKDK